MMRFVWHLRMLLGRIDCWLSSTLTCINTGKLLWVENEGFRCKRYKKLSRHTQPSLCNQWYLCMIPKPETLKHIDICLMAAKQSRGSRLYTKRWKHMYRSRVWNSSRDSTVKHLHRYNCCHTHRYQKAHSLNSWNRIASMIYNCLAGGSRKLRM